MFLPRYRGHITVNRDGIPVDGYGEPVHKYDGGGNFWKYDLATNGQQDNQNNIWDTFASNFKSNIDDYNKKINSYTIGQNGRVYQQLPTVDNKSLNNNNLNGIKNKPTGNSDSSKPSTDQYGQATEMLKSINTGLTDINVATDKSGTKGGMIALSQAGGGSGINGLVSEGIYNLSQLIGIGTNLFTESRPSLDETVHLSKYGGYINKKNPNYFAEGGGNSSGGAGQMGDIQDAVKTGMALMTNSVIESQNPSVHGIKERINQFGAQQFTANTNQQLMDQWAANNRLLDHVNNKDIRNKSWFSEFNDSLGASAKGYGAGSAFGPWGAAIGGIVGGVSSMVGSIIGQHKANSERRRINRAVDIANARRSLSLEQAADRIDSQNDFNVLANFSANGGQLNTLANGGGIHINPANRGKLTETSNRTGKSFEELSHSSDPLTRKRAIFALNARKWNHKADGGDLFDYNGMNIESNIVRKKQDDMVMLYAQQHNIELPVID